MANKKLKLLYLARFLHEETDEQHPKTLQDMLAYLAAQGITTIQGVHHIRRGYENLPGDLAALGADITDTIDAA